MQSDGCFSQVSDIALHTIAEQSSRPHTATGQDAYLFPPKFKNLSITPLFPFLVILSIPTLMENNTAFGTPKQIQQELEALLNGPASTPPAGMQPKFDDPPNLNTIIYVTKTIALTLTTLAVFIRVYTRHVLIRSMGYDDCMFGYRW